MKRWERAKQFPYNTRYIKLYYRINHSILAAKNLETVMLELVERHPNFRDYIIDHYIAEHERRAGVYKEKNKSCKYEKVTDHRKKSELDKVKKMAGTMGTGNRKKGRVWIAY